jgi:hypothetical protein
MMSMGRPVASSSLGLPGPSSMTTELTASQQALYQIFGLDRYAPRS